jgi:hypothetical protein
MALILALARGLPALVRHQELRSRRLPTPGEMVPISGTQVVIVGILALADLPVPDELRPRIDQAVASPDCWLD